jgi:hypothetical protein
MKNVSRKIAFKSSAKNYLAATVREKKLEKMISSEKVEKVDRWH